MKENRLISIVSILYIVDFPLYSPIASEFGHLNTCNVNWADLSRWEGE